MNCHRRNNRHRRMNFHWRLGCHGRTAAARRFLRVPLFLLLLLTAPGVFCQEYMHESKSQTDARMKWWREARFGMFIHWGLYSIPAGEWKNEKNHAEWIRTTARIPLEEYDTFLEKFNPTQFDAAAWVRAAKDAGMKYITITTKHHEGFCLFDSKETDFDVMSTPFKRDIMKELADACHQQGMKICWYHSIMDWHDPDYLPRRDWETTRTVKGADFRRYVDHLKKQLKELLTNYGEIGVLWFDGEWESTWNNAYGKEIYEYVRRLQPNIIVNNRVGVGRDGLGGFTKSGDSPGDFGTPEQEIPATGLPGIDWETCMTMNDNWGYNKYDLNFKSTEELLRSLADVASKGGNFLLNVGPTSEGVFPATSQSRLREIGRWMRVNGESIYGTQASPFKTLEWGRCTQKPIDGGTRLFLHVFRWPENGTLVLPGILNEYKNAWVLSDSMKTPLVVARRGEAITIGAPGRAPDSINTVVVLDIAGTPDVWDAPEIVSEFDILTDTLSVALTSSRENVEITYTTDGSEPSASSPLALGRIRLNESCVVSARCFRNGNPVSGISSRTFSKVSPLPAVPSGHVVNGIRFAYYEGDWDSLPAFQRLNPLKQGVLGNVDLSPKNRPERFGLEYTGYVRVPVTGVYAFTTTSDDGSRLFIGDSLVVDNDGLHGSLERRGVVALSAGLHPLKVQFFQKTGGVGMNIAVQVPGMTKKPVPDGMLFYQGR